MSIAQLAAGMKITRQAVTENLQVPAMAGLVRNTRAGRKRRWKFEPIQVNKVRRTLDVIAQQWEYALIKLKMAAEP